MAPVMEISPSPEFRAEFGRRGGHLAARCYQCSTCTSACTLTAGDAFSPRRHMLLAQWGLVGELERDPGVWLCHQCNDCTTRCPRDARPGDALQTIRGLMIERLSVPNFLGRLVGRAGRTWPLLVGVPILFWAALIAVTTGYAVPREPLVYGDVVPHGLIYGVYFPATALVLLAAVLGARRAWRLWGDREKRQGSFVAALVAVVLDLVTHRRFGRCDTARTRRVGHFALFWGFVGAAVTSGLIVIAMYGFGMELPLPQVNPIKILGNVSAVFLVVGGAYLLATRLRGATAGASTSFDNFFLGVVLVLIATGVAVELGRYFLVPHAAVALYVVHLGIALALFATFPYSKFAHMQYRTLAMVHEKLAQRASTTPAAKHP